MHTKPIEIISRGQCVRVTQEQLTEIPQFSWFKYCQFRLTMSHSDAISALKSSAPR